MEMTSSSTVNLAKSDVQDAVWHTGAGSEGGSPSPQGSGGGGGGALEKGTCRKERVILLSWDRSRGIIFAGFSVAFIIWAAVFFPLIVK